MSLAAALQVWRGRYAKVTLLPYEVKLQPCHLFTQFRSNSSNFVHQICQNLMNDFMKRFLTSEIFKVIHKSLTTEVTIGVSKGKINEFVRVFYKINKEVSDTMHRMVFKGPVMKQVPFW